MKRFDIKEWQNKHLTEAGSTEAEHAAQQAEWKAEQDKETANFLKGYGSKAKSIFTKLSSKFAVPLTDKPNSSQIQTKGNDWAGVTTAVRMSGVDTTGKEIEVAVGTRGKIWVFWLNGQMLYVGVGSKNQNVLTAMATIIKENPKKYKL
jgi:hypothetical protein